MTGNDLIAALAGVERTLASDNRDDHAANEAADAGAAPDPINAMDSIVEALAAVLAHAQHDGVLLTPAQSSEAAAIHARCTELAEAALARAASDLARARTAHQARGVYDRRAPR